MLKEILTCQYFGPNYFEIIKRKKMSKPGL